MRTARRALAGGLRLFRLNESRERIARGFALGLIINFLPSFGFGVLISGFVARVLGGNLLAGLVGGASLTFAWPLLFYFNVRTGAMLVQPHQPLDALGDVNTESVNALLWGQTFIVGTIINCVVVGLMVYAGVYLLYRPLRPRAVSGLRRAAGLFARSAALARA